MKIITNAKIISEGEIVTGKDILVENGEIIDIVNQNTVKSEDVQDLNNLYIAPGFIDIHCHGGDGYEFIDGNEEAFIEATTIHADHGTRVIFPTISASDFETTYNALSAAEKAIDKCPLIIPGIHLEGPYLSKEMCGGQDAGYIKRPDKNEYLKLIERFSNIISRWTYAPEEDDGEFLQALNDNNIVASMGHTAAKYDDVLKAYNNGCKLVTHLYSCTSTITRESGFRKLGVIESAYLLDDMYVEAICDGCHLPIELLQLIIKIKGTERVCLITDAIRHAGLTDIKNVNGGTDRVPYIIEDGVAKLSDRSSFAGSIATMDVILKTILKTGTPLPDAIRMMTEVPAKAHRLRGFGKIKKGYKACFTVFDDELNIK